MKWQKPPRPTEHWPHCFGTSEGECSRTIDPKMDYELGPVMNRMAYRCRLCHETQIARETRNTEHAQHKNTPE